MSDGSRDPTMLETPVADSERRELGSIPDGYDPVGVIGRGGMGEVLAARDKRIGRDVAIKRMRRDVPGDGARARFLREARIQARLDHPAIVPVYEVGADSSGFPFFTMKRLAGTTLHARLAASTPTQPLLRAFAETCHAIELAHARGVVHRDLKPENIMLGDYGEVYVLDWGLAKVLGEHDEPPITRAGGDDRDTAVGALLGTPGYMSPEQVNDASTVDRATDVYALGAILFEMLAGVPLHPRGLERAIASTVEGVDGSPGRRAPERAIAMELDALCVAALAPDPKVRPTAGALARGVERYLDGDRDFARRRTMAAEQMAQARTALYAGDRGEAMRAAGRALALDPETRDAAELVTGLMLEPPARPPRELQLAIERAEGKLASRHALIGAASYASFLLMLPIAIWSGVTGWPVLGLTLVAIVALTAFALALARKPDASVAAMLAYVVGNVVVAGLVERLFGPFIFVPAFACLSTMSLLSYPTLAARAPYVVGGQLIGWLVPVVLETAGAIADTWEVKDGALVIHSQMIEIGSAPSISLLFVTSAALIALGGVLAGAAAKARIAAQRELVTRDWQMSQLLPARPVA